MVAFFIRIAVRNAATASLCSFYCFVIFTIPEGSALGDFSFFMIKEKFLWLI